MNVHCSKYVLLSICFLVNMFSCKYRVPQTFIDTHHGVIEADLPGLEVLDLGAQLEGLPTDKI